MAGLGVEAPRAPLVEAYALQQAGQVLEAIEKLEALLADYPNCQYVLRALGYCYHQGGRDVDAARIFERAIEDAPNAEMVKNYFYFRSQIALKILDGVAPNGDGPGSIRGFDPD